MSFIERRKATATPVGMSQIELEVLYAKSQTHHAIANYFLELGVEEQLKELGYEGGFGLDLLVQMQLHKRAHPTVLVGLLMKHFNGNPQATADALYKACKDDLCNYDPLTGNIVVIWTISAELQAQIDQFQYPLPMIEQPQTVTNNKQSGYRTIKGSLILRNNHHEKDICLDHINRVNSVALSVNADVVAFVKNKWKKLDKRDEGESLQDFEKRKRAFAKYDRVSRDVLQALMALGNGFWLTHKYDKRGRTYSQGYHSNYQGNDWNKACIQFAQGEVLQ